jgi:hypothetical protein
LRASAPVERGGVAGDSWFVAFAAIFDDQRPLARYSAKLTPSIDNVALDERVALNAVLLGQTQADFELAQRAEAQVDRWGPTARDPILAAARLRRRVRDRPAISGRPTGRGYRMGPSGRFGSAKRRRGAPLASRESVRYHPGARPLWNRAPSPGRQ